MVYEEVIYSCLRYHTSYSQALELLCLLLRTNSTDLSIKDVLADTIPGSLVSLAGRTTEEPNSDSSGGL